MRLEARGTLRGDVGMLEEALLNLVINAGDVTPAGGEIEIATWIAEVQEAEAAARQKAASIVIAVTDTGPGVDPGISDRIFEPFFTTKGSLGVGLGLDSVRRTARAFGGEVRVESGPTGGASFRLILPCVEGDDPDAVEPP